MRKQETSSGELRLDASLDDSRSGERQHRGILVGAIIVGVSLPTIALALYLAFGIPEGVNAGNASEPHATASSTSQQTPHEVEAMVIRLAARLAADPEDVEGWALLGRSNVALNRLADAREAYVQANARRRDPALLIAQADVEFRLNGSRIQPQTEALVSQALDLDPNFARALWLAGAIAFEQDAPALAVEYWSRLQSLGVLNPDESEQLVGYLRDARDRAGLEPLALATTEVPDAPLSAGNVAGVRVSVSLSPTLRSFADDTDVVFVFARAEDGPRMPLAVAKRRVSELPFTVTLDDSQAMTPQLKLSAFDKVVVGARVSKSGNPSSAAGDLEGTVESISTDGAAPVSVVIDTRLD